MMNPITTEAQEDRPLPKLPAGQRWLVNNEYLAIARHDYSLSWEHRNRIFVDHDTEWAAANTRCQDGRTIKEVVDDLVFNKCCVNWAWRGKILTVVNADRPDRYQLTAAYAPYLRVAVRWMNPFAQVGREFK